MGKLRLKSTPAEDARRLHKRSQKRSKRDDDEKEHGHKKHRRHDTIPDDYSSDYPRAGPSYSHLEGAEEEMRKAEADARFREKMMDAFEDDGIHDPLQRLDGLEARMNKYDHIPRRWRGTEPGFAEALRDTEEDIGLQPWQMNDDEYAEYIRAGIWKRKNKDKIEADRKLRERVEASRRYQHALREETAKLERAEADRKRRKRLEKKRKNLEKTWTVYEETWAALLSTDKKPVENELSFGDIPWPVFIQDMDNTDLRLDDITPNAIANFLRISIPSSADTPVDRLQEYLGSAQSSPVSISDLKDVLRTTMLRFHPDKFEARVLKRVRDSDRERVKETASAVVRAVGELMKEEREKR